MSWYVSIFGRSVKKGFLGVVRFSLRFFRSFCLNPDSKAQYFILSVLQVRFQHEIATGVSKKWVVKKFNLFYFR